MNGGDGDGGRFRAVIFDVDQTLVPWNSWLALTAGLGAPVSTHLRLWSEFAQGMLSHQQARRRLQELWTATGTAAQDRIEQVFRGFPVRADAVSVVTQTRRRGQLVCLISSAIDLYVEMVAERFAVPYWFANGHLTFGPDGYLRKVNFDVPVERRKCHQLDRFAAHHGLRPEEILVVGDGATDALMFDYTGHGLLLAGGPVPEGPVPEGHPATGAVGCAWRVIHDLAEVLDHVPDYEGGIDGYGTWTPA